MSVTRSILERTFRMRHGDQSGTCFTVNVEGRRYLVTARHLVRTIDPCGVVEVQHSGKWMPVAVQLVGHGEGELDVSVLAPQYLFGASHAVGLTTAQLQLAEEVFFLGYPYGLWFDMGKVNEGFPLPLVKRAVVSAMFAADGWMLLDGHNNPGFSGGPVVRRWDGRHQIVIGVISGYRSEKLPVLDDAGNPGPYRYAMNTGIVVVYDARLVRRLIDANPIGLEVG